MRAGAAATAVAIAIALAACGSKTKPKRDASAPPADAAATVDTASDPCAACTADQQCVQRFDGTCRWSTTCEPREGRTCATGTCSAQCEQAYCPSPYQCQNRPPCGAESPNAFHCYGP